MEATERLWELQPRGAWALRECAWGRSCPPGHGQRGHVNSRQALTAGLRWRAWASPARPPWGRVLMKQVQTWGGGMAQQEAWWPCWGQFKHTALCPVTLSAQPGWEGRGWFTHTHQTCTHPARSQAAGRPGMEGREAQGGLGPLVWAPRGVWVPGLCGPFITNEHGSAGDPAPTRPAASLQWVQLPSPASPPGRTPRAGARDQSHRGQSPRPARAGRARPLSWALTAPAVAQRPPPPRA